MEDRTLKKSKSLKMDSTLSHNVAEGKFAKIKIVINCIEEYLDTWSESLALTINKHLQTLSYTIDVSIFDPQKNITTRFFVCLYNLMNKLEPRSQMAWNCVDVLLNICSNPNARHQLIHTYHFLPCLSRLVGDHLSTEKKAKILRLLQALTCGIKINWQIPHLPHLMSTLVHWVETQNGEIVTSSLGVLVNICYKNVPAVYTLSRNVDMKEFLGNCKALQGPVILEAYICQLTLIFESIYGEGPKRIYNSFMGPMFKSIIESYRTRDAIILRQIVELYTDILTRSCKDNGLHSHVYNEEIHELLEVLESNESDLTSTQHSECISLILHFLHVLIEAKVRSIESFYERIMNFTLRWTQSDTVSTEALVMLKTIALNSIDNNNSIILGNLITGLPAFLIALNAKDEKDISIEHLKRLNALLELLKVMVQIEPTRKKVLDEIEEEMLTRIFVSLLGNGDNMESERTDTSSKESISLYIYALALVNELAKFDAKWTPLQTNLLSNRRIYLLLAQALYWNSSEDIKALTLDIISSPRISKKQISENLMTLQAHIQCESTEKSLPPPSPLHVTYPLMTVGQINDLNEVLDRLKTSLTHGDTTSITTSEVLELYEYKLASLSQAEKAALSSVEAANERCTRLQHRIAQLTSEQGHIHQVLFRAQQKQEDASRKLERLTMELKVLTNKLDTTRGKYKACESQLKMIEKDYSELQNEFSEMTQERDRLQEECDKLKQLKIVVSKLEDSCKKLEKNLEKKEDLLKKANANNESLNTQVSDLESQIKKKTTEVYEVQSLLQQKSQILESIMKMAHASQ